MGCGCRKKKQTPADGQPSTLNRYGYLTPKQLEERRKQEEELRSKNRGQVPPSEPPTRNN